MCSGPLIAQSLPSPTSRFASHNFTILDSAAEFLCLLLTATLYPNFVVSAAGYPMLIWRSGWVCILW